MVILVAATPCFWQFCPVVMRNHPSTPRPPRSYFRTKSQENWTAANRCLNDIPLPNAAATRFYYSLFQAARYWADKAGCVSIGDRFDDVHATMANAVGNNAGPRGRELRSTMNDVYDLRIRADYKPEALIADDLDEALRGRAKAARDFFL